MSLNGLSLLAGVANGLAAAADLNRRTDRAYEVLFEQHADGRRRARINSYQFGTIAGAPALLGWHLFLDANGVLNQSAMSHLIGNPSFTTSSALSAINLVDPTIGFMVPNAAFGGS